MLNHHHDFHDNSRQNKINNILLYHNTTIMSESTIDYTPLSILVRMGLCRDKTCQGFKSYGPVGCKCPGNNKYSTRKSCHEFLPFRTIKEQLKSNNIDFSDDIGICEGVSCFQIGYPGMVCMECCNRGDHHHFYAVSVESYTHVFVKNYSKVSKNNKSSELRKVIALDAETLEDSSVNLCDSSIESHDAVDTSQDTITIDISNNV